MDNALNETSPELTKRRNEREETGAMWTKTMKSGSEFQTIKLRLTPEQVEHLLSQLDNNAEEAVLDLVAFPCKGGEPDGRKPTFRIFADMRE